MGKDEKIYKIEIPLTFPKSLKNIPNDILIRLIPKILTLQEKPRGLDSKKLIGRPGYRVRIGKYRLVYDSDDANRSVILITVTKREDL